MSATAPAMPPKASHFHVYEATAVAGLTTRQAAEKFKISQTRVCQIVRQVVSFMGQAFIQVLEGEIPEAQRLAISRNVAGLRMEHLYNECLAAWKDSGGETWRVREPLRSAGEIVRTTSKALRKPGYLMTALNISKQAMELAIPIPIGILAEEDEEDATAKPQEPAEPQEPADTGELPADSEPTQEQLSEVARQICVMRAAIQELKQELPPISPPNGDCSTIGEISPVCAADRADSSPQTPAGQDAAPMLPSAAETSANLASALFSGRQRPTGQQRRSRQRQAEKHLARRRELAAAG